MGKKETRSLLDECIYTGREIALAGSRRFAKLRIAATCEKLIALDNTVDISPGTAAELRKVATSLMNLAWFIDEVSK